MIHLRLRTEYSFGQTFAPISRIIERLKTIGCKAAGIVDTASTWGHVKWFDACAAAGIQPLLGVELAVGEDGHRMWFLARSESGLRELYRFSSLAHRQRLETRRGKIPRLYDVDIFEMSEQIVKFAGERTDGPFLKDVGAFVDLNPASRILNHSKRQIAERYGLRLVSTADNYYSTEEDRQTFELLDVGLKPSPQHIIELQEHQDTAVEIAASCEGLKLPKAPMIREKGNLEKICRDGIKQRGYVKKTWPKAYEARLVHELKMIREKDFESYFLVVADMVNYAKQHMLVGPSRGSAAGSLVCFLSRITEIDPIPPGLFFERFIDVSRSDLPDIDLDFPDRKRHLVFEYMANKYGKEKTAHIGTISRFQPKSALIQVCQKLNIPPSMTGAVKSVMIVRSSADRRASHCLEDTLKETRPGQDLVKMYPQIMMAAAIEGHASHTGVHAAGLLVCNDAIEEYATVDDNGIAHVEKDSAEKLGLLKIDVLGLRTLGILEDSGVDVDWYGLTFDDEEVYKVFDKKLFSGIFQFEGSAMRAVTQQMAGGIRSLTDIDAVTALARPGPLGSGVGGVTNLYTKRRAGATYSPIHPLVEEAMKETYGLPIYQEQTMAIVRNIGKFDWKQTSTIRKAMSKRMGKEFFDSMWPQFLAGAVAQGIDEAAARKTWDLINAMGAWQMNKAHTFSYAVISYWTAWLKAHHPLEFAASSLRSAKDEEQAVGVLREAVNEGLEYVRFDPQLSEETWSVKDGKLIAGFDALKGFGPAKASKFVQARKDGNLTREMIATAEAAFNVFGDIFPMQTQFGDMYENPQKYGIIGDITKIGDIDGSQHGSVVFLGKLFKKQLRNYNEDVLVKKRGGKLGKGQLAFIDIIVRDDTGEVKARIDRYKYPIIGVELFEKVELDTPILVRAGFKRGIRFGFINKWKRLEA